MRWSKLRATPASGSPTWKRWSASGPGSSRSKWATTRSLAITSKSPAANTDSVPPEYIRKQTLVNAERYITPEMKEYETLVLNAEERIHEIEARLFHEVCSRLSQCSRDCWKRRAAWRRWTCWPLWRKRPPWAATCAPKSARTALLEIGDGRHPVVERSLRGERFVPNDADL